jgi:phage terminase Nu1 subunit (DNA packaging protein)
MNNINKNPTPEEKHRMIETAAYYRAQKREFSDGDPETDWLEAEQEIEALLQQADNAGSNHQEHAAYERMRAEFKKILAGAQDNINTDTVKQAFERAGKEIKGLGEYVPETVDRAGKRLKKEVAAAVEKMGPGWNTISEKSHGLFEIWKGKGSQFLNQAYSALNSWVRKQHDKNGQDK